MQIKLNRRGVPTQGTRELLVRMNDWCKENPEHQYKFDRKYTTEEQLQEAWQEMKEIGVGVEEASVESTSTETFSESKEKMTESSSRVQEVSDFEIPDEFDLGSFDPNAEETREREYTKVDYDYSQTTEIPEPTFGTATEQAQAMTQEGADIPSHLNGSDQPSVHKTEVPNQDENRITNPQLTEADDKTKKIAAEQMVDMVLDLYEKAHEWVKPVARIKERKIGELEAKGLVNKHDELPVDNEGNGITLRELAKETNESIDDVLTPDPTFNGRVRPAMIREFTKRGWGMTDMQLIAVAFTQDLAMKGAMIGGVRKQFTEITKLFKQAQAERLEANAGEEVDSVTPDSVTKTEEAPVEENLHEDVEEVVTEEV